MKKDYWNYIRTWWWNKIQLLGLATIIVVTGVLVLADVSKWLLLVWIAGPISGVFFSRAARGNEWPDGQKEEWAYMVPLVAASVAFSATWAARFWIASAVLVHTQCLVRTQYGASTFSWYRHAETEFPGGAPAVKTYYKDQRYYPDPDYCLRRAEAMFLRDMLGRRAARRLVKRGVL